MNAPPTSPPERRDRRYACKIPATLPRRSGDVRLTTINVSYRGAFLACDAPPTMRSLVRVAFSLPGQATPLVVSGVVSHGTATGFGLQFVALAGEVARTWSSFVDELRATAPPAQPAAAPSVAQRHEVGAQSGAPRRALRVSLPFPDLAALASFVTRQVASGHADLAVAPRPPAGTALRIDLVHPHTDETFSLDATVAGPSAEIANAVSVTLRGLDAAVRDALHTFATPLAEDDLDIPIEFVAEDEPGALSMGRLPANRADSVQRLATKHDAKAASQPTAFAVTTCLDEPFAEPPEGEKAVE